MKLPVGWVAARGAWNTGGVAPATRLQNVQVVERPDGSHQVSATLSWMRHEHDLEIDGDHLRCVTHSGDAWAAIAVITEQQWPCQTAWPGVWAALASKHRPASDMAHPFRGRCLASLQEAVQTAREADLAAGHISIEDIQWSPTVWDRRAIVATRRCGHPTLDGGRCGRLCRVDRPDCGRHTI